MSAITNIINPLEPVIGKEMAAENFKWDGTQYKLNIDPASDVVATESLAGTKLTPVTTNKLTVRQVTGEIFSTVNGVLASTTGLPPDAANPIAKFLPYTGAAQGFVPQRGASLTTDYLAADGLWKPMGGGNITAVVANAAPTAALDVGGLYRFTMPANTDVRIQAIGAARNAWITSEGEYNGGSFSTTTSAIRNITVAPSAADNNVHVAGELNRVTILDVATNRLFVVTVWRMGAIAGNWSGWVQEISVSALSSTVRSYASNAAAIADATLATGSQYSVPVGGFNQLFVK